MAGCECEKETWKISYENEVAAVALANPAFTPHEISVEAARIFRPRYKSDVESKAKEQSGLTEYDTGVTFTMTDDGRLIYTNKGYEGVEIEDFSLNQLKLTPKQYSLREHQTSLAIREAFRSGATDVVTSYIRDGQDNRDIVEMRYDKATKVGKLFIRNTARSGQHHDAMTLKTIAKQEFSTLGETNIAPDVFILSDKPVPAKHISEVRHASFAPEINLGREAQETIPLQGEQHEISVKRVPPTVENISPQKKEIGSVDRTTVKDKRLHISAEIQKIYLKNKETIKKLSYIVQTKVGIAAAPLLLAVVAKELPKPIRIIEKSIQRHERRRERKRRLKTQNKEVRQKILKIFQETRKSPDQLIRKRERGLTKERVFLRERKKVKTKEKAAPKKEKRLSKKQEVKKVVLEQKKKEKQIIKILKKIVKKLEQSPTILKFSRILEQGTRKIKQEKKEKTKNLVLRFTFALVVWKLLESNEFKKETFKVNERLPGREPAPWILLSIIWYLSAIREQGVVKKTKTKKVKKSCSLPTNGIIFARTS